MQELDTAGGFLGDGKPKPVAFPDPAVTARRGARVALLPLATLIELKLAFGMTAPDRLKDLAVFVILEHRSASASSAWCSPRCSAISSPSPCHVSSVCRRRGVLPVSTTSAGRSGWVEMLLLRRGLHTRLGSAQLPLSFVVRLWSGALAAAVAGWGVKLALPALHPSVTAAAVLGTYGLVYLGLAFAT